MNICVFVCMSVCMYVCKYVWVFLVLFCRFFGCASQEARSPPRQSIKLRPGGAPRKRSHKMARLMLRAAKVAQRQDSMGPKAKGSMKKWTARDEQAMTKPRVHFLRYPTAPLYVPLPVRAYTYMSLCSRCKKSLRCQARPFLGSVFDFCAVSAVSVFCTVGCYFTDLRFVT